MKRVGCLLLLLWFLPVPASALTERGFKKLHVFSTILHYIEDNYVEEADEEELLKGAIDGMLRTLDPHSGYMSPEIYRELKVDTRGKFDGIGIEVTIKDGDLTIVAPLKGSPAERQGIKSGDKIIKIDGQPTEKLNLSQAVRLMRGKRGSKVTLTLRRPADKSEFTVSVVRQAIRVPSIKSELVENRFGYFSISSFQQETASSLKKALGKLSKERPLEGVILDLRHNPGGLLEEAIKVADLFLSDGVIVSTESRGQEIDKRVAKKDGNEPAVPMIIMVDGGSASASEIVAGALQDHKRALVLGTQTFGKGSVQTVIDLDDGGGLKLTIAKYFTPKGRSIQALGITPNIIVPEKAPNVDERPRLRERDLDRHLKGDESDGVSAGAPVEDYQKQAAIDYLKSWALFQRGDGKAEPTVPNKL